MNLQKTGNNPPGLLSLPVDGLEEVQAVNTVDQPDEINQVFDLVRLKVTDHVPSYIPWQQGLFAKKLLDAVFPEVTLSRFIGQTDILNGFAFGDGNNADISRNGRP